MAEISPSVLHDISIRFVIGAPEFVSLVPEEYFFILEEAFWFSTDFYHIPTMSLYKFSAILLKYNGIYTDAQLDYEIFKKYKQTIKVYGTMMFNRDLTHCLLVQQCGSSTSITFPKGKKSKDESGIECAIRETKEEVGIDVSDKILDLSVTVFDKITFYLVLNVDMNHRFKTNTRNEISKIFWFDLRKVNEVKNNSNYKIFVTAYKQMESIIKEYKAHMFYFDVGKIGKAIDNALRMCQY